jgi:hypothetical protein
MCRCFPQVLTSVGVGGNTVGKDARSRMLVSGGIGMLPCYYYPI